MSDEPKHDRPALENDAPWAPPRAIFGAAPMVLTAPQVAPEHASTAMASRSSRLFARIIDWVVQGAATIPLILYLTITYDRPGLAELLFCAGCILTVLSYQWYLTATRGQSIGKRFLQIKIVREDGSPAGFLHGVVLREWALMLISAIPFVGRIVWLVDPIFIFRQDGYCLHDLLANTKVIDLELAQRGFSTETP